MNLKERLLGKLILTRKHLHIDNVKTSNDKMSKRQNVDNHNVAATNGRMVETLNDKTLMRHKVEMLKVI